MRWRGDDSFEVAIVGESFYQDVLEELAGGRSDASADLECEALLVPETDNPYDVNAVGIYIEGRKVGHMDRRGAAAYRRLLKKVGQPLAQISCYAKIVGGWERRDDAGHFGVMLDIADPMGLEKS